MRHSVDGRKFGRNTSHRSAMFRNMANAVIAQEQIVTTVQKAKEVRRVVDRLITLGKKQSLHGRRLAFDRTRDDAVVGKLFGDLATRYKNRAGGYTRILKLADRRWGDAAEMAILELVDHPEIKRGKTPKAPGAEGQKTEGTDAAQAVAAKDPFSRFRKSFSKSDAKGGKAAAANKASRTRGAARKAPAAGGSNKSGGSSA